jgi:hypothetical protein
MVLLNLLEQRRKVQLYFLFGGGCLYLLFFLILELHIYVNSHFNYKMNRTLRQFNPKKYFSGLSLFKKTQRRREIKKFGSLSSKDPKAYTGFKTDKNIKSKPSNYTMRWKKKFPNALSLEEKSKASGVPLKYIKESYNRGMAAWRTGHRPGATQQQWGYARVHSFLLKGKTYHTTDSDLAKEAKKNSEKAKKWWSS